MIEIDNRFLFTLVPTPLTTWIAHLLVTPSVSLSTTYRFFWWSDSLGRVSLSYGLSVGFRFTDHREKGPPPPRSRPWPQPTRFRANYLLHRRRPLLLSTAPSQKTAYPTISAIEAPATEQRYCNYAEAGAASSTAEDRVNGANGQDFKFHRLVRGFKALFSRMGTPRCDVSWIIYHL